jgi:hypothetical protein
MKLLPYHSFEITSPHTPAEIKAKLAAHVEPERWFRWRWPSSSNDDKFEGDVREDSFLPVIDGAVTRAGRGSRIVVGMRPFVFVLAFIGVWIAAVSVTLFTPGWPFGLVMLLFLYAMTMGAFWFEASKQERVLRRILGDQSALVR